MPAAGVLRTPLAALNVMPAGSVPLSLKTGAGKPVPVTAKDPGMPAANTALLALVIAAGSSTNTVKIS